MLVTFFIGIFDNIEIKDIINMCLFDLHYLYFGGFLVDIFMIQNPLHRHIRPNSNHLPRIRLRRRLLYCL